MFTRHTLIAGVINFGEGVEWLGNLQAIFLGFRRQGRVSGADVPVADKEQFIAVS